MTDLDFMLGKFKVLCELEQGWVMIMPPEPPGSYFAIDQNGKVQLLNTPKELEGKRVIRYLPLFYSGVNDSDEKEIYDGDKLDIIIKEKGKNKRLEGEVDFQSGCFSVLRSDISSCPCLDLMNWKSCKVIGQFRGT